MNIGIVGLGLIGGSLAKAYKRAGAAVLGCDRDRVVTDYARLAEAIDGELDESHFKSCDVIFLAITPHEAVRWLIENAPGIPADTLVIDCCGTKRMICETGFDLGRRYGFTFVGGHPWQADIKADSKIAVRSFSMVRLWRWYRRNGIISCCWNA